MSFIPSFFIFFLCLSMHACIARRLGLVKVERVKQKINIDPAVQGSTIREGIINKIDGAVMTTHQEPKIDSKLVSQSSGQVPIKPLVSVSWRVPSKKGDKPAGFHSDYSMPRMRTPSHN
ncbi:hypothetical protein P3X46_023675 [Hevea brasiliensis]|uniref:Uncharacterized protein n=1 Tax=Hevea brasiliensis TaxID=3981 RepID=A0ABQ9LBP6_HEVBR|nr:hypothetical protein P3X46_023675 [Hevea brasiliensis]